ncbi:MAG: helix-turn-helix domain-containing protein [Rhodococcus sp. (in: high G+C Gram-positive bacteria)]
MSLHAHCSAIVAAGVRFGRPPKRDELDTVRMVAERLARRGVLLRDAQDAVHAAVSGGFARSVDGSEVSDCSGVVDTAILMMKTAELVGNAVSSAYLEQCRSDVASTGERLARLVDMLVSDDPEARVVAERNGIDVALDYHVLLVRFVPAACDQGRTPMSMDTAALAAAPGISASSPLLVSLTVHGGTVLVPCAGSRSVDDIVDRLSALYGVDVLAATAVARPGDMNAAANHCRELVELARALDKKPRLYRTGDLALEYQLSRPGPGRSRLRAVLAPLVGYPELLHTLKTFVESEANRRASAKSLFVHPNTVDYRLKKIEQLTGVDPLSSAGLMSLHAALVVDCLARADHAASPNAGMIAEAS